LTSEQLEVSRAERMHQNGHGTLTLEDARTWIEETGLCLFLPRRQFAASIAPSFVEAVAGRQNATPDPKHVAVAEELLVRLEADNVAVRLNLYGQPGEQPDFVVAAWVLPYVYALRGDRDWRRSPQLTGSRQVSPLAIQTYKLLETGDATLGALKHALGREVTEAAVLRAITELWQQLRIIPVISAPGQPTKWQLLRHRFQKAIAEGASTSQVTAISVLASIYLQAVIAASMEEVELFLAPLTARSKVREVLRGLVATRQVHTISLGHAPHFYVAGTLPEFATPATTYTSYTLPAYYTPAREHEDEAHERERFINSRPAAPPAPASATPAPMEMRSAESLPHAPRTPAHKSGSAGKAASPSRPHFSRPLGRSRDRKHGKPAAGSRPALRNGSGLRPSGQRESGASRSGSAHWNGNGQRNGNGAHKAAHHSKGSASRASSGSNGNGKSAHSSWGKRNGHATGTKRVGKTNLSARTGGLNRGVAGSRKNARPLRGKSSKPALTASAKAGNSKRYAFTARPAHGRTGQKKSGRGNKKRG
jgi:23S rRNA pseudouridine2605 synthase